MAEDPDKPVIEYPCRWHLRVMAAHAEQTVEAISGIVSDHDESFDPATLEVMPSRAGRWMSVRVHFIAQDAHHVRRVVDALDAHPEVRWIL